jgi:phage terminase large subunit GpA-like protein
VKLYPIGVDTAKDTIFSRMHIPAAGPGFLHLPAWVDDEYLAQLTSEKAVRKYKKGVGSVREYIKLRERNEGLDLEVYALAALYMHGRQFVANLGRRARELAAPSPARSPEDPPPDDSPPPATAPGRRRKSSNWSGVSGRGWVKGWK